MEQLWTRVRVSPPPPLLIGLALARRSASRPAAFPRSIGFSPQAWRERPTSGAYAGLPAQEQPDLDPGRRGTRCSRNYAPPLRLGGVADGRSPRFAGGSHEFRAVSPVGQNAGDTASAAVRRGHRHPGGATRRWRPCPWTVPAARVVRRSSTRPGPAAIAPWTATGPESRGEATLLDNGRMSMATIRPWARGKRRRNAD